MKLSIFDALERVRGYETASKLDAWEAIKRAIAMGDLPAWITLAEYPEPFQPQWVLRLAKMRTSDLSDICPLCGVNGQFCLRAHSEPMTDFPSAMGHGDSVVFFVPPGIQGQGGSIHLHGTDLLVCRKALAKLPPLQRPRPQQKERPTDSQLDDWMRRNIRTHVKRDATIHACVAETGATYRQAAKAFNRLPKNQRLGRGEKPAK